MEAKEKSKWMAKLRQPRSDTPLYLYWEAGKRAGMQQVVEWVDNNLEPTVPMTLDYRKWHNFKKENELDGRA